MERPAWPHSSPADRRWHLDVPDDPGTASADRIRPFRLGVRRGVVEELRLRGLERQPGQQGVLEALRSLVAMQVAGPGLLHHWVEAARSHNVSWSGIAAMLDVTRQSAHERFNRPAPAVEALSIQALWTSVQVGRDRAEEADRLDASGTVEVWSPGQWPQWGREPPRDRADLAALHRVLLCIEGEMVWLVAEARHRQATWARLGQVLGGVSRQAAQKRFGRPVKTILQSSSASSG